MTKAERTRQLIIEKTAPLFNSKGYVGTTLSDLTEATGLTKGSLYGNFTDKEEIAREAFLYSVKRVKEMVKQRVDKVSTNKKKLIALLEFYAAYVFDPPVAGGCPLLNTAIEADDCYTSMRKHVSKELVDTIDFIDSLLRKGVKAGEFMTGIRTREISYTLFCSVEGALMFARVERSREPMDIIVRHCKKILDSISN
ncbi:MAG TPA: TetR/AcrR family transcriptional regulator [Cyclobacteriaceae bacterium]|nr:TetR/AcrR family transcriptional regulator [Cyclobacteriaceae bacterium]